MAVAVIIEMLGVTEAQYATARGMLGEELQAGNLVHLAGPTPGGWRVVEVWESPEAMGAFFESAEAVAAFQAAGFPRVKPAVFPAHTFRAAAYPAG